MSQNPPVPAGKAWVLAARPKTLPAAISPVLVGSALAWAYDVFEWLPALLCLICSLLIQIATNFANDYQDFNKGTDREDRLGPTRVTAAGLLPVKKVQMATFITFGLAFIAGIYLMYIGGWPIIAIGIGAIISGLAYTGGPFPLGYNGLGDIFVFAFFGLAAVCGTFYVQAGYWSLESVIAACGPGLLSVAILVVNNHRDREQDVLSGKKTLAVKLGPKASFMQFLLCICLPYTLPFIQFYFYNINVFIFLPLLTLPLAKILISKFRTSQGREYNQVLAKTGALLFLFSILYSIGIVLSR